MAAGFTGVGEQLRTAGAAAMQALFDGMKSIGEAIVGWAVALAERIAAPFQLLKNLGGGFGGSAPAPAGAAPPARAAGGHVKAGHMYRVNDDGSGDPIELFRPHSSGTILPSSQRKKLAGGGGGAGPVSVAVNATFNVSAGGGTDPRQLAREAASYLSGEVEREVRGLFADLGMRTA